MFRILRAIIFLISKDDLSNALLSLLFWTYQLPLHIHCSHDYILQHSFFEPEENFGTFVNKVYVSDHLYCPHQNLSGQLFLLLVVALKIR